MNVRLHIERVVLDLDGLDGPRLGPADRDQLRATLEAELVGRLRAAGLRPDLATSSAVADLAAPPVTLPASGGLAATAANRWASGLGTGLAAAVAQTLAGPAAPAGPSTTGGAP